MGVSQEQTEKLKIDALEKGIKESKIAISEMQESTQKMLDINQARTLYQRYMFGATLTQEQIAIALQYKQELEETKQRKTLQNNQVKGQLLGR